MLQSRIKRQKCYCLRARSSAKQSKKWHTSSLSTHFLDTVLNRTPTSFHCILNATHGNYSTCASLLHEKFDKRSLLRWRHNSAKFISPLTAPTQNGRWVFSFLPFKSKASSFASIGDVFTRPSDSSFVINRYVCTVSVSFLRATPDLVSAIATWTPVVAGLPVPP